MAGSFHELSAKDIDGNDVSFDKFKGKVVLITNVACK
jgi:glutathione peroxidase